MKRLFLSLLLSAALPFSLLAQAAQNNAAEGLAADNKIWVVVLVLATIFAGIIAFLIYLDRRLQKLEKNRKTHF